MKFMTIPPSGRGSAVAVQNLRAWTAAYRFATGGTPPRDQLGIGTRITRFFVRTVT
jgi:hypothetical protein